MLPQLEVHLSSRGKQLNYADKIYKTKNSKFQPDSKLDIISFNIAEIPRMPQPKRSWRTSFMLMCFLQTATEENCVNEWLRKQIKWLKRDNENDL